MRIINAIIGCSRCRRDHLKLEAYMFQNPIECNGVVYAYWATCPITMEPIIVSSKIFEGPNE